MLRRISCVLALLLCVSATVPSAQTSAARVYDTFDGTNGTSLPAHTPNINLSGGVWTIDHVLDLPVWGTNSDLPVPADYDGDHKMDIAIWRPSTGVWYVLKSSSNYTLGTHLEIPWGASTDLPVPGDYDGDGKADLAVFRPSTGQRWILPSSANYNPSAAYAITWGISTDVPIVGDFDGDGQSDDAVFRPSDGTWHILESRYGYTTSFTLTWGESGDVPVPADYDFDGITDIAVYRPSTGIWYVLESHDWTTVETFHWGAAAWHVGQLTGVCLDAPAPGDYDGDHLTDLGVYCPATGEWRILTSTSGYNPTAAWTIPWGDSGAIVSAIVAEGDYDGDGHTDIAIFEPSTGGWYIVDSVLPQLSNGEALAHNPVSSGAPLPGFQIATIDAGSSVASTVSATATWRFSAQAFGGVTVRYVDRTNFLYAYYEADRGLVLGRRVAGQWTRLGQRAIPDPRDTRHDLRVAATGSLIRVYWDNVLQLEATDDSGLAGTRAGLVWRGTYDPEARVDTFEIAANVPPTVSVTTTASQFDAPASLPLTAAASDADGSIARVDFFANTTLVGTATQAPYTVTDSGVAAGTYTVTARATDNTGATTTSDPLAIRVCGFAIDPTVDVTSANGGTGAVAVSTDAACQWTATSAAAWLQITSGGSGSGTGTVQYSVDANPTATSREAVATIAGKTFTAMQNAACSYTLSPASAAVGAAGGTGYGVTVTVASGSNCTWTAASNDPAWLHLTGSGTGSGTVTYSVDANTSAARTGTATIAGMTFTVTQAAACSWAISPPTATMDAAADSSGVFVLSSPGCAWSATSGASWLHVTTASGSGDGTVSYVVDANGDTSARQGLVTVAGQTYTLTQEGTGPQWPILATTGDRFSVDGDTKTLLFVSYFDALDGDGTGAWDLDLAYFKDHGIDGVRILPNWNGCTGPGSLFNDNAHSPRLREDMRQRLHHFLEAAGGQGLVVDVTFTIETVCGPLSFDNYKKAIGEATADLKGYPHVLFDVQNEWTNNHLSESQVVAIKDQIQDSNPNNPYADRNRIVVASTEENIFPRPNGPNVASGDFAHRREMRVVAHHDPRGSGWESRTPDVINQILQGLAGDIKPIYLQEPERWQADNGGNPDPHHFGEAWRRAVNGGAAAWTFHTRSGFELDGQAMIHVGGNYPFLADQDGALRSLKAGDQGSVNLQADNGRFFSAEGGGGDIVTANRDDVGIWESFTIHDLDGPVLYSGHRVTFKAYKQTPIGGPLYLQAEGGGGARLMAWGEVEGPYETFIIEREDGQTGVITSGDRVRLQSTGGTPYFVVADLDDQHPEHLVNVNSQNEGPWEAFTLIIR